MVPSGRSFSAPKLKFGSYSESAVSVTGVSVIDSSCASMNVSRLDADYHGRENVFTKLKHLMASITPSLIPRPLSLMPPKGEFSMR